MNTSSNATTEFEDVKVMEKTMHASRYAPRELEDVKIHVKLKLAALWASVMFVYVYVDIIGFFRPGFIQDILAGRVWEFEITQTWALAALVLMTIPSLMVFLSLALPARANRWTNIVVASLYVPYSIGNVIGDGALRVALVEWLCPRGYKPIAQNAVAALGKDFGDPGQIGVLRKTGGSALGIHAGLIDHNSKSGAIVARLRRIAARLPVQKAGALSCNFSLLFMNDSGRRVGQ